MDFSIITPVLNGGPYFKACIDSVKEASRGGLSVEHIILDGGSSDGSVELARSCGLKVIQEPALGIFERFNLGLKLASGNLIGYLGADDTMTPYALELVWAANEASQRPWITGSSRWINGEGQSLGVLSAPPQWISARTLPCLIWCPFNLISVYFSREFLLRLGGADSRFKLAGDFELAARALSTAPFERISKPLACHRRTGVNHSVVLSDRSLPEKMQILDMYGPKSRCERWFWRVVLKIWLNFTSPIWLRHKLSNRVRVILGLQQISYY